MGFILPSPDSPAEHAKALIERKDAIQAELDAQLSVLSANKSTMHTPLVDRDGFPRGDIDVYAVRHARVRIIALRNDLNEALEEIKRALEEVYKPGGAAAAAAAAEAEGQSSTAGAESSGEQEEDLVPFAKVDGVAPGSPAADAGLRREDVLLKFGTLTSHCFIGSSLQPVADFVAGSENQSISILMRRGDDANVTLTLTPRRGWGGRGLLGCHISPYSQ